MNRLKHFRVKAELTQADVAKAIKVSQPHYQRYESGQAEVPPAKMKLLANLFSTSEAALMGRHAQVKAGIYEPELGPDLDYYGEVAIHFVGGGSPLLLSIAHSSYSDGHSQLQNELPFVIFTSLCNQTVAVRKAAISDLYFSSEAYDDYGPEHGNYFKASPIQLPDSRDWAIIEAFSIGEDADGYDPESVARIDAMLEFQLGEDEQKAMDTEMLKSAREKHDALVDQLYEISSCVIVRNSNGTRRKIGTFDDEHVYELITELASEFNAKDEPEMVIFPSEGYHRTSFINRNAIDYVSVPTHRFELGETDFNDQLLDR